MNELVPLDEGGEVISTQALQETHKEVIGGQVALPGRFPVMTDGVQFPLADPVHMFRFAKDVEQQQQVLAMVRRMIDHARTKLEADGRTLEDWRVTVTIAVHHKGEVSNFWFGDAPERQRISQALPEYLKIPQGSQEVKVK